MNTLDKKINEFFPGLVVRKDLVKTVKGNAIVPTYVLEYLLGQYCATYDEDSIQAGIETVKEILQKHYVHRDEAGLIRSKIKEKGRYKVIDQISVALNDKIDAYEAEFSSLGIKKLLVDSETVKAHPKLLVTGIWCIADIEYEYTENKTACPWILASLKPIQMSKIDLDEFLKSRENFSTQEWIDVLIQSMGFDPSKLSERSKMTQLIRLIPFCERNFNLIELGPKGTGKSHIYSEFSPHGILLSGGEVTVAKLFVNNSTGKIGLVGYWDVVAFDEFAGKKKKATQALVDILKNYMANKSFSRGIETLGADASMAFVGNTQHKIPYMLKHSDLFDDLPAQYHDSAFLDRLHYYIPGWEIDILRGEMFASGYGFIVDYLAEILRALRNYDYSNRYQESFTLSTDITSRDRDGVHKTFSGLMKILYPHGKATQEETEDILRFSMEGRKRVKDQLMRIDPTYNVVSFSYHGADGVANTIQTQEELDYPFYYHRNIETETLHTRLSPTHRPLEDQTIKQEIIDPPKECHVTINENQQGVNFDDLFGDYVKGSHKIVITDPYIKAFYQTRNLMEFLETVVKYRTDENKIVVNLITLKDDYPDSNQVEHLRKIAESCETANIEFSWKFDPSHTIHARHILTDTGWKISLDRGLDIFQRYDINDKLTFASQIQKLRLCKAFEVTYIRVDEEK